VRLSANEKSTACLLLFHAINWYVVFSLPFFFSPRCVSICPLMLSLEHSFCSRVSHRLLSCVFLCFYVTGLCAYLRMCIRIRECANSFSADLDNFAGVIPASLEFLVRLQQLLRECVKLHPSFAIPQIHPFHPPTVHLKKGCSFAICEKFFRPFRVGLQSVVMVVSLLVISFLECDPFVCAYLARVRLLM
jgi:hypothetical protein